MNARTREVLRHCDPDFASQARQVYVRCEEQGVELLYYCGPRSITDQAKLFRRGRSYKEILGRARSLAKTHGRADLGRLLLAVGPQHGRKVTNAGPGQSNHNYSLLGRKGGVNGSVAIDGVPLVGGKALWDVYYRRDGERRLQREWAVFSHEIHAAGLSWAGNWTTFREYVHFEALGVPHWSTMIGGYHWDEAKRYKQPDARLDKELGL